MKLTEEQLEQLKNLNHSKVNEILGITTLVVGKWYKGNYGGIEWLMMYNDGKKASGFWNGHYEENCYSFPEDRRLATKKEVKEALIKEAKKRGFENIGDLSFIIVKGNAFNKGDFKTLGNRFFFCKNDNVLLLDRVPIFEDGKWAEIIDDKL